MKAIYQVFLFVVISSLCLSQNNDKSIIKVTKIPAGSSIDEIIKIASKVKPSEKQINWQEQEFTFFIHFGVNTFTDREWGRKQDDSKEFNPTSLDLNQWAKTVKEAGGKTMIVLAKHHDGFCYWPTKYTEYSVKNSPWKNGKGDLIAEASKACKKYGIKLGIYLSPWDMVSPIYGTDEYNEHFRNQLRELLTNYGDVAEVWFDGACGEGPNGKKQVYDWYSYYKVVRELQPKAVIASMGPDVRWVGTESGEGRATEWSVVPVTTMDQKKIAANSQQSDIEKAFIPANMMDPDLGSREIIKKVSELMWYPPEVDVSIRPGWFYHKKEDSLVKTPEQLIDIYFTSVGMNAVLLLNIPPDQRGLINEHDIKSLKGMREILDKTFKNNLAADAKVSVINGRKGFKTTSLLDNDNKTYWTTGENTNEAELELNLKTKSTFDCLMLQENIKNGQRVEEFSLEAFIGGKWTEITKGTTIGYKRLLRFPEITTDRVKIKILKSRNCPEISSIGLYKIALKKK
jgi:alpha-L-fucosidase